MTAIVGAVTGTGALVWGVSQYWLMGPRIKVEAKEARLGEFGFASGVGSWRSSEPQLHQPMIAVDVVNRGRLPTTVAEVSIQFANGIEYRDLDSELWQNLQTPFRLDAHSSSTWLVDLQAAKALADASAQALGQIDRRVWGKATLSTGKKVRSRSFVRVP